MQATKAKETERTAGHSYAHVEAAIARVFGLQEADGKLKGRIQHMRRLGLTPPSQTAALWPTTRRIGRINGSSVWSLSTPVSTR